MKLYVTPIENGGEGEFLETLFNSRVRKPITRYFIREMIAAVPV